MYITERVVSRLHTEASVMSSYDPLRKAGTGVDPQCSGPYPLTSGGRCPVESGSARGAPVLRGTVQDHSPAPFPARRVTKGTRIRKNIASD
ncbi:hypothetical protein AOLI_G00040840 [Acnodon oligacanthus]